MKGQDFSPESYSCLLVLLPESFRGGCSFGTGVTTSFSQQTARHYPANGMLGKGGDENTSQEVGLKKQVILRLRKLRKVFFTERLAHRKTGDIGHRDQGKVIFFRAERVFQFITEGIQ